ncbi:hypothetical protein [Cupriavidus plantarum]|uniref:hypothetical protein n=1 Tax=Cupriavidus plantarum TaxID=942865 RepID=UPI000EAD5240|nr:hypothetical protein [Cupriavidus plantarum]RLK45630.1 hypothetical protein C7417_1652 [Cupriavidus plantarum]
MRLVLVAIMAACLSACAGRTAVNSNRALDYTGHPTRIYVMTAAGMGWGSEFSATFRAKFRDIARSCGAVATFDEVTGLELEQYSGDRVSAFGADAVLTVAQSGGVIDGYGNRLSIGYNAALYDVSQRRPVWRAIFAFRRGSAAIPLTERGAVYAVDLTNSLKKDGLLKGCSQIALGPNGRLEPGAIPTARPNEPLPGPERYSGPSTNPNKRTLKDLQDLLPPQ